VRTASLPPDTQRGRGPGAIAGGLHGSAGCAVNAGHTSARACSGGRSRVGHLIRPGPWLPVLLTSDEVCARVIPRTARPGPPGPVRMRASAAMCPSLRRGGPGVSCLPPAVPHEGCYSFLICCCAHAFLSFSVPVDALPCRKLQSELETNLPVLQA